jgi:N-acetylglucosamine-6-phosphate deacetylase
MNQKIEVINSRLFGYQGLQKIIINEEGIIEKITPIKSKLISVEPKKKFKIIDVDGDWVSLGGADLQINGGLGLAFTDLESKDIEKLTEICSYLWTEGIDIFLPTIVTTSLEKIERSLETINNYINHYSSEKYRAKIIGVHLEGPFLNYQKKGAHPEEYLLPLTLKNVKKVLDKYSKIITIITLAPELEPTGEVIKYLKSLGITISLGHSLATAQEAAKAFNNGASMVTHAFNAMPSLHHREPGLLGEAIINKNVYCGLIADGVHVNPQMIQILLQASNYEQGIFIVSDALAPIGLPEGIYPWDEREIEVKKGTARLKDGTLSGTTLPLLAGAENLVKWGICEVEQAIAMVTESPRKAIGLPGISQGNQANLLRWSWNEQERKLTYQRLN